MAKGGKYTEKWPESQLKGGSRSFRVIMKVTRKSRTLLEGSGTGSREFMKSIKIAKKEKGGGRGRYSEGGREGTGLI